jgi:hypothetical protein|tara:strand:+ start:284 stop:478 length:195 start_codon:yes stop_codon:yes gene_type:complete
MFMAMTASAFLAASSVRLLIGGSPTTLNIVLIAFSLVEIVVIISTPKEEGMIPIKRTPPRKQGD